MCFVDIVYLKHGDIVDGAIRYRLHKTNQYLQVAVTEPLQRLINKYGGEQTYVLTFLSESANQQRDTKNISLSTECSIAV